MAAGHRASSDETEPSINERTGRADEPHHQRRDRQTLSLRRSCPTSAAPRRLRLGLQLRPAFEDLEGSHTLRVHLQMLDKRTQTLQARSNPPNAGTKQLEAIREADE